MAEEEKNAWNEDRVDALMPAVAAGLRQRGVPDDDLERECRFVREALCNTLADKQGLWILSDHAHGRCEYALSACIDNRIVNVVMDRTFIDAGGQRWIVDYKISRHEGGDVEAFLDNEQQRYCRQLERYGRIMRLVEPERAVNLALYFPLLKGWRSWEYAGQAD